MATQTLSSQFAADVGIFRAVDLEPARGGGPWRFDSLMGVLAEISEETPSGAVSFTAEIIAEAQALGEPAAWISGEDSIFYPPDFVERGIDLASVAVIHAGGGQADALTAAEWLLRSGAIGLLVVDAGDGWKVSDAALGRLQKLAERIRAAVVFLTRKCAREPSLGSRISLRCFVVKSCEAPLQVDIHVIRDKRANFSSRMSRRYHGPSGMY